MAEDDDLTAQELIERCRDDPLEFIRLCFPEVEFSAWQRMFIEGLARKPGDKLVLPRKPRRG